MADARLDGGGSCRHAQVRPAWDCRRKPKIDRIGAGTLNLSADSSLNDIEHVVILMQENRSFDHYFGTLSGVRGSRRARARSRRVGGESYPIFDQFGYEPGVGVDPTGYLQPFHLKSDPPTENGQTTNDITHDWGPQHQSWNNGAMDSFVTTHIANDGTSNGPGHDGLLHPTGPGLLLRAGRRLHDLRRVPLLGARPDRPEPGHVDLGDDRPAGSRVDPASRPRPRSARRDYGTFTWTTMPEQLSAAGVSWKVYNDPTALLGAEPVPLFQDLLRAFDPGRGRDGGTGALAPTYPASFLADVTAGTLPSVSWIMSPLAECEHPAAPPEYGEYLVQQILQTLVSNPDVWSRTVLFVVYDENGGFFDHVPPPTPPAGTAG